MPLQRRDVDSAPPSSSRDRLMYVCVSCAFLVPMRPWQPSRLPRWLMLVSPCCLRVCCVHGARVDACVRHFLRSNFIRTRNYVERALDRAARLGLRLSKFQNSCPRLSWNLACVGRGPRILHAVCCVCVLPSMCSHRACKGTDWLRLRLSRFQNSCPRES